MARFMARQGDILITQVDDIPDGTQSVEAEAGRLVLARGEATGHHHSVAAVADTELLTTAAAAEMFLRTSGGALVTHQEHAPVALPPGNYRITRQREYAPERPQYVLD